MRIKKVIAIDGIEDFVYIEADKEQDVQNVSNNYFMNCSQTLKLTFIKIITFYTIIQAAMRCNKYLYSSKKFIKRLSPKEKQDLMAPKRPRLNIQMGSFVRINKRDEYFGDLARVNIHIHIIIIIIIILYSALKCNYINYYFRSLHILPMN